MWIRETEQTARYRFWFDVREPGAAAYAGQLGAEGTYLLFLWFGVEIPHRYGWEWFPVSLVAMAGLCGAIRRLELWAAAVLGMATLAPVVMMLSYGVRRNGIFLFLGVALLLIVFGVGIPMAMWAAWVHRGVSRAERWDLLGLAALPKGTTPWKRRIAVLVGAARPESG